MSEDRTEQATPKRREDAAKKGNLLQSRDLDNAATLLLTALLLSALGPFLFAQITQMVRYFWALPLQFQKTTLDVGQLCTASFASLITILSPLVGGVAVMAIVVHGCQTRFALFEDRLKVSLEKLDPVRNLQNLFSRRQLLLPFIILAKVAVIGMVAYLTLNPLLAHWLQSLPTDAISFLAGIWDMLLSLILRTAILLVMIGVVDYGIHWWQREKELMMTREETKEEFKHEEGSPELKQKIRQKQNQLARQRMMAQVPQASVVITNPTALAIALQYRREAMAAPQVIAKGKDLVAARIRAIAVEHHVPILTDKPLARAMYPLVEVGGYIPAQFFQAVATILAYVYRQKSRKDRP